MGALQWPSSLLAFACVHSTSPAPIALMTTTMPGNPLLLPKRHRRRRNKSVLGLLATSSAAAYFLLFAGDESITQSSITKSQLLSRLWRWQRNGIDEQYYRRLTEDLPQRHRNAFRRIAQATLTDEQIQRFVQRNGDDEVEATEGKATETEREEEDKQGRIRVLLYITTHLSQLHQDALELLWPILVQNRPLLQNADVLFYSSEDVPTALLENAFPTNSVLVRNYNNTGRQEGATQALQEALEKDWFGGYDWVLRVNPDVIIRNDTWVASMMMDEDVHGIFSDCSDGMLNGPVPIVQTDFFAVRPERIDKTVDPVEAESETSPSAEMHATFAFQNIWSSGRAAILPDNRPNEWCCRVGGEHSSVEHNHEWLMLLLDCLREAADDEEATTTCLQRYNIPTEETVRREEEERSLRGPVRELSPFVPRAKPHSPYYPSRKRCDWKA